MNVPEVRFVDSAGARIAYQAFGDGPPVVLVPPLVSNIELSWEHELYRRVFEYLARHLRVLMFDKRGIGLSDRFEEHPTLAQRIDDIRAVMDAERVTTASLVGLSEGGLMGQLFAIEEPARVERLVLVNSVVGGSGLALRAIYAAGPLGSWEATAAMFGTLVESWGDDARVLVDWFCPSQADNDGFVRWAGRLQRLTATRADFRRQVESIHDVAATFDAESLDRIEAPTLVIGVTGDRVVPVGAGRLLADRLGARFVEIDGDDHFLWVMHNWRDTLDSMIEFLTDRPVSESRATRRFAVVMFTDIVGSTETATRLRDSTWRELLDSHDRIAWSMVERHGGRIVKSTGDGLLAVFESPSSAVQCATELRLELRSIGVEVRAGLHAGEIEVRDETDIAGIAVHIAARVEQAAQPGEVLISATLHDLLLGTETPVRDAGEHDLKGIDGSWRLFAID